MLFRSDLTTAPIKDKERYVVGIVSSIRMKGAPSFEDAELIMKQDLIESKKADRFTKQLAKYNDLTSMAKNGKTEIAFVVPPGGGLITGTGKHF